MAKQSSGLSRPTNSSSSITGTVVVDSGAVSDVDEDASVGSVGEMVADEDGGADVVAAVAKVLRGCTAVEEPTLATAQDCRRLEQSCLLSMDLVGGGPIASRTPSSSLARRFVSLGAPHGGFRPPGWPWVFNVGAGCC